MGLYLRRRPDLSAGDRVSVTAWSMRNQTGTLLRPARLPNGKPAWLVQMDDRQALWRGRTRVGGRALIKIAE
jgi:hypothetical protein